MKKKVSLLLAAVMIVSILAGCGSAAQTPPAAPGTTTTPGTSGAPADSNVPVAEAEVKEAPVLADQVAAGTLPALEERLPAASDVYVEAAYTPAEVPSYGGTMRFRNGGKWDFGPTTEEPLFRLLADGTVEANVAKGYDLSSDGLTYTIYLREGMKWSDGTPFTASDCVYYYNYVLVPEVDNATGKVTKSHTTKYYNWYMSEDPADGILKPAQVRYVDDYTFTITLYSPKPTLLQAICIDNKWMFCPKEWYKDIVAVDVAAPHWTGVTDLKLIGGDGLVTVTEEEALANAKAKSDLYTFEDYSMLCKELNYYYWQYAGRPTLRPWVLTSALTETTLVFQRNAYYWKVDAAGRQLPYMDTLEYINMDEALVAQEVMAGNIDLGGFSIADFPLFKASEANGIYSIKINVSPSWSTAGLEFNQTYKDAQYVELFENIDFRHALSIAVDRNEMNNIIANGMATPAQFAAPKGTSEYIEGAPEKWIEYDVAAANALLDGIPTISKELNADGFRTFVGGDNDGKAVVLEVETVGDDQSAQAVALLAQYYKKVGIQVVEVANTDNNARNEKYYTGDQAMCAWGNGAGSFNVMLRPDNVAANRTNTCWVGKYGLEHLDHYTPKAGSAMEGVVNATLDLVKASTMEQLQAAAMAIVQSHYDNTWIIGFLNDSNSFFAVNNRIHNYREGFVVCDELRFQGYAKPYTWFIQE